MTVNIAPSVRQQFVDVNGNPLSGAKLFTYVAGTTTKQNTYTTSAGSVANSNPIVLDSAGRTPYGLWLDSAVIYKFVFAPSTDTDPPTSAYFTEDNITNDYSVAIANSIKVNGSSTITSNIPFSGFKATGLGTATTSGDAVIYGQTQANVLVTNSLGFTTGAGGTVTQLTSKSTGVTLNAANGTIVINGAALASGALVGFTLTNSFIIGTSQHIHCYQQAGGTAASYFTSITDVATGSCKIWMRNINASSLTESFDLRFFILNGSTS